MEYRLLGKSALSVSRLGFGCMSLNGTETNDQRLLDTAFDQGINFFDTADLYGHGNNERLLGKAFRQKRKDIVLATKVGNQWQNNAGGLCWNPRKEYILSAVNDSLQRLQTDYIDLYQLHGGTMNDDIEETIGAFELLQKQGKIRYYGISSIRPNVIRAYACRSNACSVMMQYSLLDRRPEESCLPLLADKKIAVLARGTLASGLLTGKPAKSYLQYGEDLVKKAATVIEQVAQGRQTKTGAALQFAWQQPAITAAIVGIRTTDQLQQAIAAEQAPSLQKEALALLEHSVPLPYYKEHR